MVCDNCRLYFSTSACQPIGRREPRLLNLIHYTNFSTAFVLLHYTHFSTAFVLLLHISELLLLLSSVRIVCIPIRSTEYAYKLPLQYSIVLYAYDDSGHESTFLRIDVLHLSWHTIFCDYYALSALSALDSYSVRYKHQYEYEYYYWIVYGWTPYSPGIGTL